MDLGTNSEGNGTGRVIRLILDPGRRYPSTNTSNIN